VIVEKANKAAAIKANNVIRFIEVTPADYALQSTHDGDICAGDCGVLQREARRRLTQVSNVRLTG
jgi:hypothetical protein